MHKLILDFSSIDTLNAVRAMLSRELPVLFEDNPELDYTVELSSHKDDFEEFSGESPEDWDMSWDVEIDGYDLEDDYLEF